MSMYSIIGAIVILAIIVLVIFLELKHSSNKKAAIEFVKDLSDDILEVILDTINSAKPEKYTDLAEFEADLLNNIYDSAWDMVSKKAEESEVDGITKLFFKYINKETLKDIIDDVINKNNVLDTIANNFGANKIETSNLEAEDDSLAKEYSDQSQYVENSTVEELDPAEEPVHSDDEIAALNPQTDEEGAFDIEDDSVEVVTDKKEIISTTSKSGQVLYYEIDADGKKKRVSKEYAQQHMEK